MSDVTNSYVWNAKSEIKTGGGVNYTYDGDGDRVQKSNGKIYWFGAGSQVLDESDAAGNITDEYIYFGGKRIAHHVVSTNTLTYYVEDMLGSSRALATSTGTLCYDADFYPYGGEHDYVNTCAQNYKFTGKERDPETNNDDFDARYYSSAYGRFLSADWSSTPTPVPYANLTNPQTLNLYAMVSDNPESFADLDGHKLDLQSNTVACATGGSESCDAQQAAAQKAGTAQNQLVITSSVVPGSVLVVPGSGREQSVDYSVSSMDSNGNVSPPSSDTDHNVVLSEKVVVEDKDHKTGACVPDCKTTNVNKITDKDSISAQSKGHTVEKRFTIDGEKAKIYDPKTKQAYDYVNVVATMKGGFKFEYQNDAPSGSQ